jgi:hypothetical protein
VNLIQSVSFGAFLVLTHAFYVMSKPKRLITCSHRWASLLKKVTITSFFVKKSFKNNDYFDTHYLPPKKVLINSLLVTVP